MLRKLFFFRFVPANSDLALLLIRVLTGLSILLRHGMEKVFQFPAMYTRLTSNHHYVSVLGVGPSLVCAMLADGILSVLLMLGIATRWCAVLCFVNLFVAWGVVLNFPFFTPAGSSRAVIIGGTQGEMMVAYMAALLAVAFAGGGKYAVDTLIERA